MHRRYSCDTCGTPTMCASEATRYFRHCLTAYEEEEIQQYENVYYVGQRCSSKIQAPTSGANSGYDTENGEYIFHEKDHIAYRYELIEGLGNGAFGQVFKAIDHKDGSIMALKLICNRPKVSRQAKREIEILQLISDKDPEDRYGVVRMIGSFTFRCHVCIAYELLGINLYEYMKKVDFHPMPMFQVRSIAARLLITLTFFDLENIIHCDLKPENVLLRNDDPSIIKVADLGSASFDSSNAYTYIQSRFYRAPEVIMEQKYSKAIDWWSFGCILCELVNGDPVFPGEDERDQLACIIEFLGPPPKSFVEASTSRRRLKFFDEEANLRPCVDRSGTRRKPESKSLARFLGVSEDDDFLSFVCLFLRWDPLERASPREAMLHRWIRDEFVVSSPALMAEGEELPPLEQHEIYSMYTASDLTPRSAVSPEVEATNSKAEAIVSQDCRVAGEPSTPSCPVDTGAAPVNARQPDQSIRDLRSEAQPDAGSCHKNNDSFFPDSSESAAPSVTFQLAKRDIQSSIVQRRKSKRSFSFQRSSSTHAAGVALPGVTALMHDSIFRVSAPEAAQRSSQNQTHHSVLSIDAEASSLPLSYAARTSHASNRNPSIADSVRVSQTLATSTRSATGLNVSSNTSNTTSCGGYVLSPRVVVPSAVSTGQATANNLSENVALLPSVQHPKSEEAASAGVRKRGSLNSSEGANISNTIPCWTHVPASPSGEEGRPACTNICRPDDHENPSDAAANGVLGGKPIPKSKEYVIRPELNIALSTERHTPSTQCSDPKAHEHAVPPQHLTGNAATSPAHITEDHRASAESGHTIVKAEVSPAVAAALLPISLPSAAPSWRSTRLNVVASMAPIEGNIRRHTMSDRKPVMCTVAATDGAMKGTSVPTSSFALSAGAPSARAERVGKALPQDVFRLQVQPNDTVRCSDDISHKPPTPARTRLPSIQKNTALDARRARCGAGRVASLDHI